MKVFKYFFISIVLFVLIPSLALALYVWYKVPTAEQIKGCLTTSMFKVELCPKSGNFVPYRNISQNLVKAVVISEDSGFWQHQGFDFSEIENSVKKNWSLGKFARGGSTISQQLAKNMFLSRAKTPWRKIAEAYITVRIEETLTKKEILEKYFNIVQFGKDIFGVKKAAQFYFKKNPDELDLLESAFLTMLLPSPEKYNRSFFKKQLTPFAKKRISKIIGDLHKYGRITTEEYELANLNIDTFITGERIEAPTLEEPSLFDSFFGDDGDSEFDSE